MGWSGGLWGHLGAAAELAPAVATAGCAGTCARCWRLHTSCCLRLPLTLAQGVMRRCLDADPAQRPTFDALLAELDALRRAERCSSLEAAARTAAAG